MQIQPRIGHVVSKAGLVLDRPACRQPLRATGNPDAFGLGQVGGIVPQAVSVDERAQKEGAVVGPLGAVHPSAERQVVHDQTILVLKPLGERDQAVGGGQMGRIAGLGKQPQSRQRHRRIRARVLRGALPLPPEHAAAQGIALARHGKGVGAERFRQETLLGQRSMGVEIGERDPRIVVVVPVRVALAGQHRIALAARILRPVGVHRPVGVPQRLERLGVAHVGTGGEGAQEHGHVPDEGGLLGGRLGRHPGAVALLGSEPVLHLRQSARGDAGGTL